MVSPWDWQKAIVASSLGPTTRHVLHALATFMDAEGACWPSTITLAEATGYSERAVVTHLAHARKDGWFSVGKRENAGQAWKSNAYCAAIPGTELCSVPLAASGSQFGGKGTERRSVRIKQNGARHKSKGTERGSVRRTAKALNVVLKGTERGSVEESKEDSSLNSFIDQEAALAIRDALTDIGVEAETAEALMIAFATNRDPLDADSVLNLVRMLDGPNAESQALQLLRDGLGMVGSPSSRQGQEHKPSPAEAPRFVSKELEPDLWRGCCDATGHAVTLTNKDGKWAFPAELVERLASVE